MGAIAVLIAPLAVVRGDRAPVTADPVCTVRLGAQDRSSLWAPPLDRIVNLHVPEVSIREALDQLAVVAKIELSYSAELLPAAKRVCLALDRVPVGAVLESLLSGTSLRSIVLGSTQVVLAPSRAGAVAEGAVTNVLTPSARVVSSASMSRRASVLDRVVVTGSPDGAPQRGSPFALDVIDGATLARHGVGTLGEALDLAVPGVWSWTASAGTLSARYGSIRGASSFGVSAMKIYLDGIEVANPLLVTQLDPARVERVEVIRGPQGAALYGADAISGVVNILTRHDGTPTGAPVVQLSTTAGLSATAYAPRDAFVQDHALSFRRGSSSRSLGLGLNIGTVGAYVPGASEQRLLADADVRVARANAVYTGTARFSAQRANASTSLIFGGATSPALAASRTATTTPLWPSRLRAAVGGLGAPPPDLSGYRPPLDTTARVPLTGDSATGQSLSQYTVGGTMAVMPNLHWTHTVIAGVDGYRLRGLSSASLPTPVSSTSALGEGIGAADRGTLRLRTVGRFDVAEGALLAVTFAAEQALTRDVASELVNAPGYRPNGGALTPAVSSSPASFRLAQSWITNSGVSAQAMLSWQDRWYVSAGGRAERTSGATAEVQHAWLPMLGAAYVREYGPAVVKLRGAFGTGIRPARTLARGTSWMGRGVASATDGLQPERQSGLEAGADVVFAHGISLHVTRFDQEASGLIQPVGSMSTSVGANGRIVRNLSYTLQNVGAIANRGWELQATARKSSLQLTGTLSLVDSRVARTATGYRGELRVGDRMLDVPASTMSLSATWAARRWSFSSTATRAADWIGYDRTAIGEAVANTAHEYDFGGPLLRRYWMHYGGVTRWRANASYRIRGDLSVLLGGENLLNVQRGAPDNATVTAGRTLSFGLRSTF
ncbi:TonB-dependent receptor [Gemmatimonas sp.]|uniref:TonB-dependent receptor n=1 Tax=Gemmatimonas sp. TaxID=1962908 RepID=UPI00286C9B1E|nr:TonB-dependent receptor [Gemmatimonas sp.]